MTGATVTRPYSRVRRAILRGSILRQVGLMACAVALYFGVRGLTESDAASAVRHAQGLVAWESEHGLYLEPTLQRLVEHSGPLTAVMNWVYVWGHWPVIIAVLVWLVRRHPEGYRITRNAMLLSGAIGLVVFAVYPLAPPRLAGLGLIDTVTEYSTSYRVLQPQAFVNQYAAMPSLHVGWDLLMGLALITYGRHLAVRVIGVLLPMLMLAAVLTTANHYVLDAAAGTGLVLLALVIARRTERRRATPAAPPDGAGPSVPRPRAESHERAPS
jgi:hypothetical protein